MLEFVARYGVVPREVVAMRAKTGRAVTAARERRLREAGLVEVLPGVGDSGRLCLCTRRGLRTIGREELPTPSFSPATLNHSSVVTRVAVQLEGAGHHVLSEREIEARERAEGKRAFSAECRGGRFHRPDLVILAPDSHSAPERSNELSTEGSSTAPIAVEVELTAKSSRRLDEILRAWRRSLARGQFSTVRYLCGPKALPYVQRALARTGFGGMIEVEALEESAAAALWAPEDTCLLH